MPIDDNRLPSSGLIDVSETYSVAAFSFGEGTTEMCEINLDLLNKNGVVDHDNLMDERWRTRRTEATAETDYDKDGPCREQGCSSDTGLLSDDFDADEGKGKGNQAEERSSLILGAACGGGHSALLLRGNILATFGHGSSGQLGRGIGHGVHETEPMHVPFVEIGSTGSQASVTESCLDPQLQSPPPRLVTGSPVNVRGVSCGELHTAAVDWSGAVWTWGLGQGGRLGHGNQNTSSFPRRVRKAERR